jgi:hypothetical protein
LVPNPNQSDIDHDGQGDVCDSTDAAFIVDYVRLRHSRATTPNGSIRVSGSTLTHPPADTISAAAGLVAALTDGTGDRRQFTWGSTQCLSSARGITCQSEDRTTRLRLRYLQGTQSLYEVELGARRLSLPPPLVGPVKVVITHNAGIDRVGSLASCRPTNSGVICTSR